MQGLIDQEDADRGEHIGGHPHPADGRQHVLFHEFFAEIIQQEKDHEEDHGKDQGQADTALADDGAEGCADQEHDEAGDGRVIFSCQAISCSAQVVLLVVERNDGWSTLTFALVIAIRVVDDGDAELSGSRSSKVGVGLRVGRRLIDGLAARDRNRVGGPPVG